MKDVCNKIKKYLSKRLAFYETQLKAKTSSFISLEISSILQSPIDGKTKDVNNLFNELVNNVTDLKYENNLIALIGGPGVGKTTFLIKLATMFFNDESRDSYKTKLPVFISAFSFNDSNLPDNPSDFFIPNFRKDEKEYLLELGMFCFMFDGINESSKLNTEDIINKVYKWYDMYPNCNYIVTCRTLEYPNSEIANRFCQYKLLPISDEQIRSHLNSNFGNEAGNSYFEDMLNSKANYLINLCRNPLIFSLVLRIIQRNREMNIDFKLSQLKTKSDVYSEFCKGIDTHNNRNSSEFNAILKNKLLYSVSFYMEGLNSVYMKRNELSLLICCLKYNEQEKASIRVIKEQKSTSWSYSLLDDLEKTPYINLNEDSEYLCFIHQSFQEYFAACYIADKENYNELISFLLDVDVKRSWETISFLCSINMNRLNEIIYCLLHYAYINKNPYVLLLAKKCILDNSNVDAKIANECCIWLLDAFKYCWNDEAYRYELFDDIELLLDHTSEDFPERLKDDILYFSDKYSSKYTLIEYPEYIEYQTLLKFIDAKPQECKLSAIYTLGLRKYNDSNQFSEVVNILFSLINHANNDICEQSAKAIKSIVENNKDKFSLSDESIDTLIGIINNNKLSGKLRTYALNTMAEIGDIRVINTFKNYLSDKTNPYRDSASWSLQVLIKNYLKNNSASNEKIDTVDMHEFYYNCLISESEDETGKYSKGNLVYTLSEIDAFNYLERIKSWLINENDPYVIEDGINAVGTLEAKLSNKDIGHKFDYEFLLKFTNSNDSVIRAKTYEGILKSGYELNSTIIEKIQTDQYSIVNMLLEKYGNEISKDNRATNCFCAFKERLDNLMDNSAKNNVFDSEQSNIFYQHFNEVNEVKNL